ncbi:hypothetical protein D9M71_754970 [compost metagenome]
MPAQFPLDFLEFLFNVPELAGDLVQQDLEKLAERRSVRRLHFGRRIFDGFDVDHFR